MSRSFRTEPKRRIAARNVPRDAAGRARLPRIVARQPRQGDVHPLSKRLLSRLLAGLPLELWHGLTRIELRAREGEVGRPFASYHPRDRSIRLHSLPMEFRLPPVSRGTVKLLEGFGAEVEAATDGHRVSWDDPRRLGFWFHYEVLLHELGHHHRNQYRGKTRPMGRRLTEEILADRCCYWAFAGRLSRRKYPRQAGPASVAEIGTSPSP